MTVVDLSLAKKNKKKKNTFKKELVISQFKMCSHTVKQQAGGQKG